MEPNPGNGLYEVYVGGIPLEMAEVEGSEILSELFGNIMNTRWMEPRPNASSRVCFVGFRTEEEAQNAIMMLDNYRHPGTGVQLKVRPATQQKRTAPSTPRQPPHARGPPPNARSPSQMDATNIASPKEATGMLSPKEATGITSPKEATSLRSEVMTSPVPALMPNTCAVCNKAGIQQCSQCKAVRYCSRECQVKHWTEHQKTCLSMAQGSSPKASATSPAVKAPSPSQTVSSPTATEKILNKLSSRSASPKDGAGAKPPGPPSQPKEPDLAQRLKGPIQRQNERSQVNRPSMGQDNRRNDARGNDQTRGGPRQLHMEQGPRGRDQHRGPHPAQGPRSNDQHRGPRPRSNERFDDQGPHAGHGLGSNNQNKGPRTNERLNDQNRGPRPRSSERSNDQNHGPRSRSIEFRGPGGHPRGPKSNDGNQAQGQDARSNNQNRGPRSGSREHGGLSGDQPGQKEMRPLKTIGETLKKGQQITVQVMDMESPSQFWVQLFDEQISAQLLTQQEQLYTHYENKANLIKTMPKQEPLVAALFPEDSQWYRAEVLDHKPGKFLVRYVDYGNKAVVDSIFSLERKFYEVPIAAINCGIAGIRSTSKPWSNAANDFFKRLLGNGLCKATVVESTHGLVLLDLLTPDGSRVSEKMLEAKHAESSSTPASAASTSVPAASGASAPVPAASPRSQANTAASSVPQVVMAANLELSTLAVGPEVLDVMVTDAESPSDITIQTRMHMAAIVDMKVEITKQQANYTGKYVPQKVGELVLAKFSLDNEWYRAEVLNMGDKNQIHVLFVDYGNREVVNPAQIAAIPGSNLAQLPVYGIKCSLDGVGKLARGKTWDPQVLEPCIDLLKAVVKKKQDDTLYMKFTKTGSTVSINKQLVDSGILMPSITMMTDLPTLEIPLAPTAVNCTVVVANSPSDICLHVVTDTVKQAFKGISDILSCANLIAGYVPQQGEVVCSFFDDVWNRAEVVESKDNKFTLRYIDFGNVDEVGPEGIAKLAPGLEAFPPVAVVCWLPGVGPSAVLKPNALSTEIPYQARLTKREFGYDLALFDAQGTALNPGLIMAKPRIASRADLPAMTTIRPNTEVQTMVTHVNSLTDFYILDTSDATRNLVTEMSKVPAELPSQAPKSPGQLVYCFIEGEWYRMYIVEITATGVNVQSLDYGFQQEVSRDSVKEFPAALVQIPPVARHCALADLSAPGDASAVAQFKEMVENRHVNLIVTETCGDTTLVKICDETAPGTFLNAKFLQLDAPLIDLNSVPTLTSPQPVMPSLQPVMPPLQSIQPALPKADMPQQFTGIVVFSIHPQHFYVQNVADQDKLADITNKVASSVTEVPPTEGFHPVTGNFCLGQNDDQEWYRCRVTDASAQGFEVNFVDFGDSAVLPVVRLRPMPQELQVYPALAYRCCLAGVFPTTEGPWAVPAVQRFKELTENILYMFVKNPSNESFFLVKMSHVEHGDLAQTLVGEGVAARRHMEAPAAANNILSEGEVSAVEEENNRLKQENEKLRRQFEQMKLALARK